jgi:hypothetical protein
MGVDVTKIMGSRLDDYIYLYLVTISLNYKY